MYEKFVKQNYIALTAEMKCEIKAATYDQMQTYSIYSIFHNITNYCRVS